MSTRTLQIQYNTRPVRLAFLVNEPESATLENIFRLNSTLWGGLFNPVVVLDGSARKQVGRHYAYESTKYEEEQLSLLKAFDPDLLVNYSSTDLPPYLLPFRNRTCPPDVMRWNPWGRGEITSFLEVWPFLAQHWREEVRFLQKPTTKFGYIDLDAANNPKTYLTARFGSYPQGSDGNQILVNNFGGQLVTYDDDFRKSFSPREWLFPIGITTFQLDIPAPSTLGSRIFFLLDADNMFDIVDYWNLRAAGYRVFPLPTSHYCDFSQSAKAFAKSSVYPINQTVSTLAEIVKARSVEDAELDKAGQWLGSLGADLERLSLRGWVPRFQGWDRDSGIHPEMQIRPPVSEERTEVVVFNDGHGTLRANPPDCLLRAQYMSQHWATEFQAFGTTDDERSFRLPWLRPECDALVNYKIGLGERPYTNRVSQHGIVVLQNGNKENVWIEEPRVDDILSAYLKDGGLTYTGLSTPGLTLERIVEQMGGLLSCALFQNPGVREVVETLARGSNMPHAWIRQTIFRSLTTTPGTRNGGTEKGKRFERILLSLVSTRVLRQGFELKCGHCGQRDWYHVSDLGEDFKCKKCFRAQQVPPLNKEQWRYIVDGLFRLKGRMSGCLTTILALLFLRYFVGHDVKYVPSFDYSDGANRAERDFALLGSEFLHQDVDVIIGECKSENELEQEQRAAIRNLGEKTGAYLAFCTLSDAFTTGEKNYFEQLVAAGQRPILLTRKHLEMPYHDVSKYRHEKMWLGGTVELLSRLTISDVLGKEFADKNRRRI